MKTEIQTDSWQDIDCWSHSLERSSRIRYSESVRLLDSVKVASDWDDIGTWWECYSNGQEVIQDRKSISIRSEQRLPGYWTEFDSWWNLYTDIGRETARKVAELIKRSNKVWANSEGPFDEDPLSSNIDPIGIQRGPLHPHVEEDWSQWLAQLLSTSEELVSALLGVEGTEVPKRVIREAHLPKTGGNFRRADILVILPNEAVSIEVKLSDEGFGKTEETARLVERHYGHLDWTHVLLLPMRQRDSLDDKIEPDLKEVDGQLQIDWDNPGPIDVVYWRDVTSVVRSLLLNGDVVDSLWAANAYLFCAVVEQRVMKFQSLSAIDRSLSTESVPNAIQPIVIADTLEQQLSYLQSVLEPCRTNSSQKD